MSIIVKEVSAEEPKSIQEIEEDLISKVEENVDAPAEDKAEEPIENKTEEPEEIVVDATEEVSIDDNKVLEYIKQRYDKEVNSLDDLLEIKESNVELPDDVLAFLNYKKETGRGIDDFVKLNKDYSNVNEDSLLVEYYLQTEDGLDREDVDFLLNQFAYDSDLDDDSEVSKKKLAKKREIAKAKKYFEDQKNQYKLPAESATPSLDTEVQEELESLRGLSKEAESIRSENVKKSEWFVNKTKDVFNSDFKGFEFDMGEKKITFNPGDPDTLIKSQSTPMNFIGKYLDDKGYLSDAPGYHRALSIAMNPEKFAKLFYEQGIADAVETDAKKSKNINMETKKAPETTKKGGFQIRSVTPNSGSGLKIKSLKK